MFRSTFILLAITICHAQDEIPVLKQSLVITASSVVPALDRLNKEVFEKTLFSRDDQVFQLLDAGINARQQIAGSVARRIVTDHAPGTQVAQSDRMGIIRFGSRVDLFLPAGSNIRAKLGDVTTAGVTVLGELPR